ncbi:C39 family peptidase [Williamsia sp. DF01-3]|uniref:C39 family peptidase n=1 Tax=Williamsia sp. DF01-3 TaxID=2934157 RepID=UPI001FF19E3A|nr:C39 family peptidase [Williamsia sp. DF01-3]MCK0519750.1 C39 family peptidase [Williamsia sp. DF01-3]
MGEGDAEYSAQGSSTASASDDTGTLDELESVLTELWPDQDAAPPDEPAEPSDGVGGGDADEYSEHWFQQAVNGTCVPASVAQIVAEYSGEDIQSEEAFVEMAQDNGYFLDGEIENGMPIYAAADLLEQNGIPATVETGTMDDLATALEEGRGVMLYVDSGEYWDPEQEERDEAMGRDQGGDHCVVISEIDTDKGVVYLSDPGHPDGDRMEVPLDEFEEAWGEADNTMIVCDEPSPNAGVSEDDPTRDPLLDDLDADETPGLSNVIDWLTDRPWNLLPVVIGGK